MLLLLGIVKKNGILQIDCTNKLRAEGVPLWQAILDACQMSAADPDDDVVHHCRPDSYGYRCRCGRDAATRDHGDDHRGRVCVCC